MWLLPHARGNNVVLLAGDAAHKGQRDSALFEALEALHPVRTVEIRPRVDL